MRVTRRAMSWILLIALFTIATLPATGAVAREKTLQQSAQAEFYTKKAANKRFVVQRYAVVDSDGNLVRGERVASATRSNEGVYRVTFNRNVSECAFNVTPLAENGALPIRFASASTGAIWGVTTVGVAIFKSDGTFLDGGFSITMTC